MIDFERLEQYRENNRIEAKKAVGGLPHSIWETYSAFANTMGGVILLGVLEQADKTLYTVRLPNPERLVEEFWEIVNNPQKVSSNILSVRDVFVQEAEGNRIVVINVPRAQRSDRPVYLDGNMGNSYRRNGEGDYRCTREEINSMVRDAAVRTQDMRVLDKMDINVLEKQSVKSYRARIKDCRPKQEWEELEDADFLYELGAAGRGEDGELHPTAAGLLMFGRECEIIKEFPDYFLDYQEWPGEGARMTKRIVSASGDWSGNVYDFYFRVCERITRDIGAEAWDGKSGDSEKAAEEETGKRSPGKEVQAALREAMANCITNADYCERGGLLVVRRRAAVIFSNPGGFRVDVEAARGGGISDPRNAALIRLFCLVDIGECSGTGIPNIYSVWKSQGWPVPNISESFNPERVTLTLPIGKKERKLTSARIGAWYRSKKTAAGAALQKAAVVEYLTVNAGAGDLEIAELLGVRESKARGILSEMMAEGTLAAEVVNKVWIYRLRA